MIRIRDIKLPVGHTEEELIRAIAAALKKNQKDVPDGIKGRYRIAKKSVDARDKEKLRMVYTIDLTVPDEERLARASRNPAVSIETECRYCLPEKNHTEEANGRPVIVGTGPAGLFCGLLLARCGYAPVLIERGEPVEQRIRRIEDFWAGNRLDEDSNVQFGEGGAGTFSDGKLNTGVKDRMGRNRFVLETFVEYGAPSEILYLNKPHIGTDNLRHIIRNMRRAIEEMGGEVRFGTKLTDLFLENGAVAGIEVNGAEAIACRQLVLAPGHSARDTFSMLYRKGLRMEQKPFAVGLRVEHPAEMIRDAQYGRSEAAAKLPPADYKLTYRAGDGRGVYSFCMCPGGFVVNASSEQGRLAVNGMSDYDRSERNSNSAIVVSVGPDDFESAHPLAGVAFQRRWEENAYQAGRGMIPVQLLEDLRLGRESRRIGDILPNCRGQYQLADLSDCLPRYVLRDFLDGMNAFGKKIRGFDRPDTVLCGVETRTSSPVRIVRGEEFQSNIAGIYPCGEGAGYAGGITSAAIDGIRVAEAVMETEKRKRDGA